MIDAGVLPRDERAMPLWRGRAPRAYRHGRGRWRGWPPRVRGRVRLRRCGVEGEALCVCVRPALAGLDSPILARHLPPPQTQRHHPAELLTVPPCLAVPGRKEIWDCNKVQYGVEEEAL